LTGGGSRVEELPQQLPCKYLRSKAEAVANAYRLEEAQDEPEQLAQETIIENLDPQEAYRLSRVRNIGIAVS
jgi:elongation factor G